MEVSTGVCAGLSEKIHDASTFCYLFDVLIVCLIHRNTTWIAFSSEDKRFFIIIHGLMLFKVKQQ